MGEPTWNPPRPPVRLHIGCDTSQMERALNVSNALLPQPLTVCAQAKCLYCGRYGALGACEGCGAPNRPTAPTRYIDDTSDSQGPRYIAIGEPMPPALHTIR